MSDLVLNDLPALEPPKPTQKNAYSFTKENAAEMARKAVISRVANWQRIPEEDKATPTRENAGDCFQLETLARVREHLKTLNAKMDEQLAKPKLDTKSIRDLTDAISKLENVEQRLSNRPLPGSFRPVQGKAKRSSSSPEPEEIG